MDMLPSEYIKVSYFWPQSAKISFCLLRVSKKLKKIEKKIEFFFHKTNYKYHTWIVPTFGVPPWGFSIYGVKLCSTHKYKIPSCGISQIDGLQAGTITYEYYTLLVVKKCVKPTFPQQIRWWSLKVIVPACKPSIWLLSPQGILFLWVEPSFCQYSCLLDIWLSDGTAYCTVVLHQNTTFIHREGAFIHTYIPF